MFTLRLQPVHLTPLPQEKVSTTIPSRWNIPCRRRVETRFNSVKRIKLANPPTKPSFIRTAVSDQGEDRHPCVPRIPGNDRGGSEIQSNGIRIRSETRLIDCVPYSTTAPLPTMSSPELGTNSKDMWCEKYKHRYVGSRVFYNQFKHWCLSKTDRQPCCIYGESGCGKSALVNEGLADLGHVRLDLNVTSFMAGTGEHLLRSALRCPGFSRKTVVIHDISLPPINKLISSYLQNSGTPRTVPIPLVLITSCFRQFSSLRKYCYCISLRKRPSKQAVTQLVRQILTLETSSGPVIPSSDIITSYQGNVGRLLCGLQLTALVGRGTLLPPSTHWSITSEDMRVLSTFLFSGDSSLSDIWHLLEIWGGRLRSYVFVNYLSDLDDSFEPVSETLSCDDVLPDMYRSTCLGLILKSTKWNPKHPTQISAPDEKEPRLDFKKQALRLSALIKGTTYDSILDMIDYHRDYLTYLGPKSRYLFGRYPDLSSGSPTELYPETDTAPQKQQLLLIK